MRNIMIMLGLSLTALACDDEPAAVDQLEGSWDLVGYSDTGIPAEVTGTATFEGDGTFSVVGSITFPGEPEEDLALSGTWSGEDNEVTLTSGGESSRWRVVVDGDEATLTLLGVTPPTTISLRRHQATPAT